MTWENFVSYRRFGYDNVSYHEHRTEFIRDYDRIIFLSAFRRLQDKTQVFPLPGNVFVHNRLTHSLEVASVGRSLGTIIGKEIEKNYLKTKSDSIKSFYVNDLSAVIASACLAHDSGNPAFGHSGEKAIANFFQHHKNETINGGKMQNIFSHNEWEDLTNFEGNANALRLLTRKFKGKLEGGQRLTYLTLASILKYPCESLAVDKNYSHKKKYGFFQSEKEVFTQITEEFGFKKAEGAYLESRRHPFVYLVEAADDICYRIIDMEDAHRIGILATEEIIYHFLDLLKELYENEQKLIETKEVLQKITDKNEKVTYLRAKCISALVHQASNLFVSHVNEITEGTLNNSLLGILEKSCPSLEKINDVSISKIYNHHSVIEVELAGYNVMSEILKLFVVAILNYKRSNIEKKCLLLIPDQFNLSKDDVSEYNKVMGVLDFVSGMTDGYATELYRKIKGIDIASHR